MSMLTYPPTLLFCVCVCVVFFCFWDGKCDSGVYPVVILEGYVGSGS